MRRLRGWADRLGGRIALLLLGALLLEFIGSELLFSRIETGVIARQRAGQLAQQIGVADRLMAEMPAAARKDAAARLWREPLTMAWQPGPAPLPRHTDHKLLTISQRLQAAGPDLAGHPIHLAADRGSLRGAWQLPDGSWMAFRASGYLDTSLLFHGHIGAVLILLMCVTVLALVLARLLGRPLRKLADAADMVGREDSPPIAGEGPKEVRRVAAAFNAMQARLLDQVQERILALAAVSHDLRTPIARLRLRTADIDDRDMGEAIGHDLDEMESFIRSLLDYLRGADPEEERLIDLASLVVTVVHDAQDLGGDVRYTGPASLEVVTRPLKLQRSITNLVQNAVRHAGQARVRLVPEGEAVHIIVEDDGPGIPADQLETIFEPFRRLETSRNRGTGGAGLGLSIVRRSVSRLGGAVRLENRAEGGLRAIITL
ncbi:MAG: hypothetical protein B7Z20_01625 [Sphingobium sp. 32-64-5]|nr:MAG: hypothetical protein B7Z20_01625 [Sphingobium sp. 32-64-5]